MCKVLLKRPKNEFKKRSIFLSSPKLNFERLKIAHSPLNATISSVSVLQITRESLVESLLVVPSKE